VEALRHRREGQSLVESLQARAVFRTNLPEVDVVEIALGCAHGRSVLDLDLFSLSGARLIFGRGHQPSCAHFQRLRTRFSGVDLMGAVRRQP
jgi:hypothetical protein